MEQVKQHVLMIVGLIKSNSGKILIDDDVSDEPMYKRL